MIVDTNGNITVNKGDTFILPVFININKSKIVGTRFKFRENDTLIFHLMESNKPWECPLIRKEFTIEDLNENGDIVIEFTHEDTQYLAITTYYYEMKLIRNGKDFLTIVPRRKFIVIN